MMEERYSRNRIYVLPEEQQLIKHFRILLGGAGLGSIIAECALRFGFEYITIVDGDLVEESNLNRQNYRMQDIGHSKSEALKKHLLSINPNANISSINKYIDTDNVENIIKGHNVAINALDFKSEIPLVFDKWCQKYNISVIHPFNIGWGGLAFVVEPTGQQLIDFSDNWQNFEVQIIEQIINDSRSRAKPKIWIENIISQYLKEKTVLPPPQLSIASWITAGLCTNLLFCIATGQKVKYYPKFYLSSIIDDRN